MADEIQLILQSIGDTLYDFLVLPGKILLSELVLHTPGIADRIGIDGEFGNRMQLVFWSLFLWVVVAIIVWLVILVWQNLTRIAGAIVRTALYRISQAIGNLKTTIICKIREYLPNRARFKDQSAPMVEFDDLDLAVLRSISARGPGFTQSAPELAEQFTMRPAQVQKCLNRLFRNKMLDTTIGSTDGFDNYRLTDYGAAFLATWQRQEANA
ncbi:MAG: hypothetical protein ACR2QT_10125 [Woeseiaceae bacterium]